MQRKTRPYAARTRKEYWRHAPVRAEVSARVCNNEVRQIEKNKKGSRYPGFCPSRLVKLGVTITLSGLLGHEGGHLWTGLALLHAGFAVPRLLPCARCALTAPFHPYPCGRFVFCGTFRGNIPRFFKRHTALWSPEVPPPALKLAGSGYLAAPYIIQQKPRAFVRGLCQNVRLFAGRAEPALGTRSVAQYVGFFKGGVEGGQYHQLRYFLPGFKHKVCVV